MAGFDASGPPPAHRRFPRRLAASVVALLTALAGVIVAPSMAQADGPTTFTNSASIAIPAAGSVDQIGPASPYPSAIAVSGMAGAVTAVQVVFHSLTHGALNDVDAMVVAPTGQNLVVLSDIGDPNTLAFASNATLTFDDAAAGGVPSGNVPTGTYRPTNTTGAESFPAPAPAPSAQTTLAGAFTGINPNGTWQLYIVDDATGDTGSMAGGWSLVITTAQAAVPTTTTVTTSGSPSTTGSAVTFTATVTAGGSPVTTGTVAFTADGAPLGSSVALNASGQAQVTTSALAEGTHAIVATYSGSTGFLTSNGSVSQRVDNATVVTGSTFCNPGTLTIPDAGPAVPYPSNITVSGLTGPVTKVTATLKGVSHSVPVDLDVMLSGPVPTTNLVLMSDAGGTAAVSGATIVFDDGATGPVPTPLVSGTFRPTDSDSDAADAAFPAPAPSVSAATTLATFNGASGNGVWSLWVVDDASGDSGSISGGWCLTFTTESPTTTSVVSSVNPSTVGQAVTFTATVTAGGAPVTTGTVQFSDGGSVLASGVALNASGSATFTTSVLTAGTHTITATYSGAVGFAVSDDSLDQVVNANPTATVLGSSLNPSTVGQAVTFTATVTAGGAAVTTGTVEFSEGGSVLASGVALSASGSATFTTSALTAGTHTITATYSGAPAYSGSSGSLDQVVNANPTAMVLGSSLNPSTVGQAVTFTATVTAGGAPVTTGTVQFSEGGTVLASGVALNASGSATLTTSALTAGTHTITATYSGAVGFAVSDDSLDQVVNAKPTTTSVVSSVNPSTVGQSVTFTATVTAGGAPVTTGTVQFSEGGSVLASAVALDAAGSATFTTSVLTAGTHTITATYSGAPAYAGSSGSLDQVVNAKPTTTSVSSNVNPSTVGQAVTFTATVTAGGAPVTTGTVQFSEGGSVLASAVALDAAGSATFTTSVLTAGTHTITATYSGAPAYAGSSDSLDQVVNANPTTTSVVSSVNPSTVGQAVTFTATVTAAGAPVTSGTVQFSEGGTGLASAVALDAAASATFTTSVLTAGTHTITATYSGAPAYAGSSGSVAQVVNAKPTIEPTPPAQSTPPAGAALPPTGTDPTAAILTAGLLLLAGATMVVAARKRGSSGRPGRSS